MSNEMRGSYSMRVVQLSGGAVLCVASMATADILTVPGDFPTIQSAIDASSSGDHIMVSPGIFNELIDFSGKAITVEGSGSGASVIDGAGFSGPVVRFASEEGSGSVLANFRVSHGSGEVVNDPVFGSVKCGGGIFVRSGSPIIHDCVIESNETWGGAGMCNFSASPTVSDCTFQNNVSEGHGGGIYNLNGSEPLIERCSFESNTASWGGGITNTIGSDATITACDFIANTTMNVGGGMFNRSYSSPIVTNCNFFGNIQINNPLGSGGGMCTYGAGTGGGPCYPVVNGCVFEGNTVNGDGGGMANAYYSYTTISNCIFRSNSSGRDGGGVAAVGENEPDAPSNVEVFDCVFESNFATGRGGGFFARRSEPSLMNCTIRDNSAGDGGGGVYFFESGDSTMGDTALCGNSTVQIGGSYIDLGGNTVDNDCQDCVADITGDGTVGVDDMLDLISNFGPCGGCAADVNGDGIVGVDDILIVLSAWGDCA